MKKNLSNLQLANQKQDDRIAVLEENKNSIDKKKAKLKEVEESVMAKLQVKQNEIDEIKAAHAREMAQLYRNMDEMRDKVIISA